MYRCYHVIVRGVVQGVGYRAFVARLAGEREVTGWARNLRDGSVEAILAGRTERVHEMLDLLRKGPPMSEVTDIAVEPFAGEVPPGFAIRPTG